MKELSETMDGLSWLINNETLTIVGTGEMTGVCDLLCRDSITTILIGDGVTSIARAAFRNFRNLTSITLPNSVVFIGDKAFEDCPSPKNLFIDKV
jgi:hypothetical protein